MYLTDYDFSNTSIALNDTAGQNNETAEHQYVFFGGGLSITLLISAIIGLISSTGSFIYVQFFLKLNPYLKWVLRIASIVMIASNATIITGSIIMAFEDIQTLLTCGMIIHPARINSMTLINSVAIISVVRFYMYSKSLKAKIAPKKYLLMIIIGGMISNQVIANGSFVLGIYFKVPLLQSICSNQPSSTETNWGGFLTATIIFTCVFQIGLTLYFDVKMILKMKKQQNSVTPGQNALVPWKSTNESIEEDLKVPIMATLLSTIVLLLSMVVTALVLISIWFDQVSTKWVARIVVNTAASLLLPLLLLFTIKHRKEEAQKQPPKGLQFYDEDVKGDAEDPEPENPEPEDPEPEDPDPEDPEPEDPDPEDPEPKDPDPEDLEPEDPDPDDGKNNSVAINVTQGHDLLMMERRECNEMPMVEN